MSELTLTRSSSISSARSRGFLDVKRGRARAACRFEARGPSGPRKPEVVDSRSTPARSRRRGPARQGRSAPARGCSGSDPKRAGENRTGARRLRLHSIDATPTASRAVRGRVAARARARTPIESNTSLSISTGSPSVRPSARAAKPQTGRSGLRSRPPGARRGPHASGGNQQKVVIARQHRAGHRHPRRADRSVDIGPRRRSSRSSGISPRAARQCSSSRPSCRSCSPRRTAFWS
jgi:hypothetical protein